MRDQQTYATHVRWYPFVHFVITPILLGLLLLNIVRMYQEPSANVAMDLLLTLAAIMLLIAARLQALKAQDRVIRLEERLRYRELLPADVCSRAASLTTGQMIARRFSSDSELGELLDRVLSVELTTSKEIKTAIRDWRGDYVRV